MEESRCDEGVLEARWNVDVDVDEEMYLLVPVECKLDGDDVLVCLFVCLQISAEGQ